MAQKRAGETAVKTTPEPGITRTANTAVQTTLQTAITGATFTDVDFDDFVEL